MSKVIGSSPIYPTSRLVNVVKLDECQPLEDYNYNYLGWRPDQTYESGINVVISVIPVIQYVVMVDDLMKMKLERQGWFFNDGVRIAVSPSQGHLGRGNYDSAKYGAVFQLAEKMDLKFIKYRFESDSPYQTHMTGCLRSCGTELILLSYPQYAS